MNSVNISSLSVEELWTRLLELARNERAATYDLVETLAETDRRGLHKDHQYISLFECCVVKLGFSEAAAYRRIRAARALKLFPPIGPLLKQGKLTLEAVAMLHPFLKDADVGALVSSAIGKRIWEIERLVANRRTEAPRRDVIRFVPAAAPSVAVSDAQLLTPRAVDAPPPPRAENVPQLDEASSASSSEQPAPPETAPCHPEPPISERSPEPPATTRTQERAPAAPASGAPAAGVRIGFTADADFFKLLKEAQAAMRHKYPDGRLEGVFRDALQALLRKKGLGRFRKARPEKRPRDALGTGLRYFLDRPLPPAAPNDTMPNR